MSVTIITLSLLLIPVIVGNDKQKYWTQVIYKRKERFLNSPVAKLMTTE